MGRSYLTITKDVTRVMNRIKALYRSWGIPCSGAGVYAPRHRAEWLARLVEPGVRVRAEHSYQQLGFCDMPQTDISPPRSCPRLRRVGDKSKSREAYQDFFALWKDADPDIPILREAKAEYAKLQ